MLVKINGTVQWGNAILKLTSHTAGHKVTCLGLPWWLSSGVRLPVQRTRVLVPGLGQSQTPRSSWARSPRPWSLGCRATELQCPNPPAAAVEALQPGACALQREGRCGQGHTRSSWRGAQKWWRPSDAINKQTKTSLTLHLSRKELKPCA